MNRPARITVFVLGTVVSLLLASCAANFAATRSTPATSELDKNVNSAAVKPEATPTVNAAAPETSTVTGNLLSPEQKAQLSQLPIPIIAPTQLPAGFRLVAASGEKGQYANGDDDSGYSISYQGDNNTCINLTSSKDGPRGQADSVVQTQFGAVKVFTETRQDKTFIYSFIPIAGNPSLTSGGTVPDPAATGDTPGWKRCNAVSMEQYIQVLKSLEVVK